MKKKITKGLIWCCSFFALTFSLGSSCNSTNQCPHTTVFAILLGVSYSFNCNSDDVPNLVNNGLGVLKIHVRSNATGCGEDYIYSPSHPMTTGGIGIIVPTDAAYQITMDFQEVGCNGTSSMCDTWESVSSANAGDITPFLNSMYPITPQTCFSW